MQHFTSVNDPEITQILLAGGVGVLRTDTLYGLVGRADNEAAVERIYQLKGRDADKSPIVLIGSTDDMFDDLTRELDDFTRSVWPGPVSVIVPSVAAPHWLRRDNGSVAYRLPGSEPLRALLQATGPLIAPSANPQGDMPAMNVAEAQVYFGDQVDFYVDGGQVTDASPSQLVAVDEAGNITRLR